MITTAVTVTAESAAPLTWTLIRSTGIIAIALLTIGTVAGIIGPSIRKPSLRLTTLGIHTAGAAAGTLLLLGHILSAIADSYIEISPLATVIPGLSFWEPLWVALGVIAFDMIVVVIVTSILRGQLPRIWRSLHLLSYPALALAWGHTLTAGTDRTSLPMLIFALISFAAVATAMFVRLTRRSPRETITRTAVVTPRLPEQNINDNVQVPS